MNQQHKIRRAYITVGNRQVHLRYAGTGPAVVLIHQSPTSGRTLDLHTVAFARAGFQALALDIPGLGRSDSLGVPRPEIEDLAIELAETLNALGVEQVALYGSHTGALVCTEFAIRWPQRVSVMLVDGYPVYSEDERARRVATYFPQFEIRWDGSHLLWLWCRYREQYLFWPWNIPSEITQAKCDVPDPEFLHEGVIDMLRAGNGYRFPYAAAFRCRSLDLIGKLRVPTYFLAYPDDSLTANLNLLHDMPTNCHIENMLSDRVASIEKEISLLRAHTSKLGNANLNTERRSQGITKSYVDAEGTQLALRAAGPEHGRPLVVIAPAPGSASMLMAEIEQFSTTRPVLAFDAPGCGDSDVCTAMTVSGMARTLNAALDGIGVGEADIYALHGGCAVAIELAALRESKVRRIVLDAPARPHLEIERYSERYALPIEPRWDGSHLIELWHATRNRRLFRPWFDQRLERRYTDALALEPESINRDVLAYLESWSTYHLVWKMVLSYPVLQRAQALGQRVHIAAQASDEFAVPDSALPEPILPRVQKISALLDIERCA
jgi:pimeloyl-ACP methyl ester carboxylesterase